MSAKPSQSLFDAFRPAWREGALFLRTPQGKRFTYADLDAITAGLSRRLQRARLRVGDRLVALVRRSEWNIFLYLACVRAGVVYVPLNPQFTAAELVPVLADAEPGAVVCDPALVPLLRSIFTATAPPLYTLDAMGVGSLQQISPADVNPDVSLPECQAAAIIFTSGTTGRPKGVLMPHELFVGKARALGQALGYTAHDRLLHTMPLYHAHGLFMTLHCVLSVGASILLLPKFDSRDIVRHLPEVSVFSGVPTIYARLLGEPGLKENAAAMRLFISGSAALPPDVFMAFEQRSGHRILECWGMSETMTNTANPLHGERRPGSVGKALPGVTLRVVDGAGQPLASGLAGTLEVGFTSPFGGYWRRAPSEQPVVRNGSIVTGDVGFINDDGYLTIVGRTSDMIISGGYNVYPREVEVALEELAEIGRAAVFAVPHPDYGEAVVAAVEPAANAQVDPAGVLGKLRHRLVGYKRPKAVFLEAALPLTELGKIQRSVLARKYADHFTQLSA